MNYIIEGSGALVNEKGEETPLKAVDFVLVNPDENWTSLVCGVESNVTPYSDLFSFLFSDFA